MRGAVPGARPEGLPAHGVPGPGHRICGSAARPRCWVCARRSPREALPGLRRAGRTGRGTGRYGRAPVPAEPGQPFGGAALLGHRTGVEEPPDARGPAVANGESLIDAVGQRPRRIVDLAGLGLQRRHESVLRMFESRLRPKQKTVPPDQLGRLGIRRRRDGDGSLQLLHVQAKSGFDLFGEQVHDIT
ncbi:protein of unknown function [Streptomyces murinus]